MRALLPYLCSFLFTAALSQRADAQQSAPPATRPPSTGQNGGAAPFDGSVAPVPAPVQTDTTQTAANPPPPNVAQPMSEPVAAKPGVHEHDGFYVRFGLGFSGYADTLKSSDRVDAQGASANVEGVTTGFATTSELAIGGTVSPGFVLGGGIYSTSVLTTTFTPRNDSTLATTLPTDLQRPENFAVGGIFGDWYFHPRRGLHVQGALGVATLTGLNPESPRVRDRHTAVGGGLMLGIGQEWWVADQWSIGVLARLTAGILKENVDDNQGGGSFRHLIASFPSALFVATYH